MGGGLGGPKEGGVLKGGRKMTGVLTESQHITSGWYRLKRRDYKNKSEKEVEGGGGGGGVHLDSKNRSHRLALRTLVV